MDHYIEKIYFQPGDTVELKQNIPNKPKMVVSKKKTLTIKPKDEEKTKFLQGILCFWFTTEGLYQDRVFNTKDLIKLNL